VPKKALLKAYKAQKPRLSVPLLPVRNKA